MQVIKSKDFSEYKGEAVVVAMGTFDGLHLGHQAVINKAIKIARKMGMPSGVYTFTPHPLKVVNPDIAPPSIISNQQKEELLEGMGIDYLFQQEFTKEFSLIDYQTFIKDYMVERIKVAHLVIGEDFHFGKQGQGDLDTLTKIASELGFAVTGINIVKSSELKISSTRIRELVMKGEICSIPQLLGRYYRIEGIVIHGYGRGSKIGIPTANLEPVIDYALPPKGVYAGYVYLNGNRFRGIVNFGFNPTFGGNKYSIEIHIINFPADKIYGEKLALDLVGFIRQEMTFSSSEKLVKQIKEDILYTDTLLCYN